MWQSVKKEYQTHYYRNGGNTLELRPKSRGIDYYFNGIFMRSFSNLLYAFDKIHMEQDWPVLWTRFVPPRTQQDWRVD